MNKHTSDTKALLRDSYKHGSSFFITESQKNLQTLKTYLLGAPLRNSLAPLLHNTLFSLSGTTCTYETIETDNKARLLELLAKSDTLGTAVTMPLKVCSMDLVDAVTDEARSIGAINTVFIRRDDNGCPRLIGTNTDCIGVKESFLQNIDRMDLAFGSTQPGLVIGGGGACRSAVYALNFFLGVKTIYLVNRLKEEVDDIIDSFRRVPGFTAELRFVDTVEFAGELSRPYLVVGTIPDREPKTEAEILTKRIVETLMGCEAGPRKNQGVVLEMCYHPRVQTSFYQLAERNGWRVIPGTEAMIWQGVAQHILWTEKDQVFDEASTLSTIRGEIRDALTWRN
ncbi:putative quinate dehydrogenase [Aspergillus nomiae NRRL 13137]|uniref:Putative quinate dehydrogenase n=1 Tax=Aspergillus nomiae NRRL (strain ATCC 15546 / NRRL 13137 / CBS 260.88 / M93) TaxID=1509407 RepID=A0A0L1JDB6_ASPN3|nr:putative quinate dehydrogenase [Aspergillus nomiae NRRL 13137]KNG89721.1 putative quinate dehydrogenase [Aspergillus nomiae NRRL 13137]